jgi:hypothetical protein
MTPRTTTGDFFKRMRPCPRASCAAGYPHFIVKRGLLRAFCFYSPLFGTHHDSHYASRRLPTRITPARSRWPKSPHRLAPVWPRPRWPARSMARWSIPVTCIEPTAPVHHHGQGCRWTGGHSPFHGAPAGLCGQGVVSGRPGHDWPGDREWFLLRLLLQASLHARGSGGDREKMTELAAKDEPVVRRVLPRDEAVAYFKGRASTTRPRSLPASQPMKTSACTEKASLKTCVVARTCPARASSGTSSS